eukprot:CAMPEP_0201594922 /NCGR_PEP_ID=MMETSP0190_2-20130828/192091_1 /ASSEMBLY_ACC=CAM_ASM_000263 /TAXON_ID=37353 /ORGANISM="Rosalina sp." /LENGTH=187 /DNA_ID=CAMNT_0048054723 /DNA_START=75 /DNA_END=639 /DNA_ORIENTATION=+
MGDGGCEIAGDVGVVVQIALAVLVGLVLMTEYLVEYLKSLCSGGAKRSFRTFWFDSYKICAGALVSHIFNIVVSISIDKLSGGDADQCAIYALAFFYEACGVPFVQLLQYGVIQYAKKMASQSSSILDHESSINGSERHLASVDIDDGAANDGNGYLSQGYTTQIGILWMIAYIVDHVRNETQNVIM